MSWLDDAVERYELEVNQPAFRCHFKNLDLDQLIEVNVVDWDTASIDKHSSFLGRPSYDVYTVRAYGQSIEQKSNGDFTFILSIDAPAVDFTFNAGTATLKKITRLREHLHEIQTVFIWKMNGYWTDNNSNETKVVPIMRIVGSRPNGSIIETTELA